jgi:hypothetical protein
MKARSLGKKKEMEGPAETWGKRTEWPARFVLAIYGRILVSVRKGTLSFPTRYSGADSNGDHLESVSTRRRCIKLPWAARKIFKARRTMAGFLLLV